MPDDKTKKPKINLKDRLSRTTNVGMQAFTATPIPGAPASQPGSQPAPPPSDPNAIPQLGSAAPPSTVRPSSVPTPPVGIAPPAGLVPPAGIAPPAGLSPGIPVPLFQPQQRRAAPEPKPTAVQQTIKVDVGEEVEAERKRSRGRIAIGGVVGVVIGLAIGFTAGGASEKSNRAESAARGAGSLTKDVKEADERLKELSAKLSEAAEKLGKKTFPDDLAQTLAGLKVPFDDTHLDNRVIGLQTRLLKPLLDFTNGCKNADKARERIANLLGMTKEPITKAWKEEKDPVANFSVVFHSEGGKPAAELVPNATPFSWKGDWAEKYNITRIEQGKPAPKEAKRYTKGDVTGGDLTAIPVDPKTTAALTSDVMIGRLSSAIYDLRLELEGNKDDPRDTGGLIKIGDDLANELQKASLVK